jgi:hypothetical protein
MAGQGQTHLARFAESLRTEREDYGLTPREVADRSFVPLHRYLAFEAGAAWPTANEFLLIEPEP